MCEEEISEGCVEGQRGRGHRVDKGFGAQDKKVRNWGRVCVACGVDDRSLLCC